MEQQNMIYPKSTNVSKPKTQGNAPTPRSGEYKKSLSANQDAFSLYKTDIVLYKLDMKTLFTPRFSAFNCIVSTMVKKYGSKDHDIISPAMLNYYSAAMIWFRIISLKNKNGDRLTAKERELLDFIAAVVFNIPKPLAKYVKVYGNITTATQQHLFPDFPAFPNTAGHSVWALRVHVDSHELFETIPCMYVAAQSVMQELEEHPDVDWQPDVVPQGTKATSNLLGYVCPSSQEPEVRALLHSTGVRSNTIGETIPESDINFELLMCISDLLERVPVFENEATVFAGLDQDGHPSQLVKIHPTSSACVSNVAGTVSPFDYTRDSPATIGMAIVYTPNIVREGKIQDNHYLGWSSLMNTDPQHPVVDRGWYANRNAGRNYPLQYDADTFTTVSREAGSFRSKVFQEMSTST